MEVHVGERDAGRCVERRQQTVTQVNLSSDERKINGQTIDERSAAEEDDGEVSNRIDVGGITSHNLNIPILQQTVPARPTARVRTSVPVVTVAYD